MLKSDDQWVRVADAFADAALQPEGWYPALEMLVEATGSTYGQLVCFGPEAPPNTIWTVDPDVAAAFFDEGFSDPASNPRIRAGMLAPVGSVLSDMDFITPAQIKADPSYRWGRSRGLSYICLTTLLRMGSSSLVGLAVNRSEHCGHISTAEKQVFASLSAHARTAVRTQMMLESSTAGLLVGAMEAMSLAAFACDHSGKVMAMSPLAEVLVSSGCFLSVQNQFLTAERFDENVQLTAAVRAAAAGITRPGAPLLKSLFIRSLRTGDSVDSLLLDVISLPKKPFSFGFSPHALVVVRCNSAQDDELIGALKLGFGLTDGEARVAVHLANGFSPQRISTERGVSIGTVRTQIKNIYDKMGINRQGDLVARLRPTRRDSPN